VELTDLNSANGIVVGGGLTRRRVALSGDDVAVLGESGIQVVLRQRSAVAADRSQGLAFNRSPRVSALYEGQELTAPEPPERVQRERFPLIATLLPLLFSLVLVIVMKNLQWVLFALLSPVMMIGQYAEPRFSGRRQFADAAKAYRAELRELSTRLDRCATQEVAARCLEHPATGEVVEAVRGFGPLMWSRRPSRSGFLQFRLGWARCPHAAR